ncbi:hypothetical protein ACG7TL_008855 [Trametes sanguinea]
MAAEFEIDPIFSTSLVFFSAAETHHASDLLWNRASVVVAEILPSIDGLAVQLSPECFACGPGFVTVATCVLNSPDIVMSCDESLRLVAWKSRDAVEWSRLRFSLRGEFLDFLWLFLDARHRLCNDTLDYQDQMNLLVQQYHALLLKVAYFVFRRGDLYVEITTELGVFADAAVRLAVLGPAAEAIVAQRQRSRSHEEAVWLAAYELLLHAEVGMIGALSLDIALSQRLLIERLKAALLLRGPIKPHDISLFASLSANATIDTLRHMLYEVRRVRLITVALDNNLQSLLVIVDPGPTSSGAAPPPVNCRSFASVLRGARDILRNLHALPFVNFSGGCDIFWPAALAVHFDFCFLRFRLTPQYPPQPFLPPLITMSTMTLLQGASVSPTLARIAIEARSKAVATLSGSLDKEVEQLREALWLPREPKQWAQVLAARLACHERVFQHRTLQEIIIHRDTLIRIHMGTRNETGDLLEALSSHVRHARQSFSDFETTYQSFTVLRTNFLFSLDIEARDACDAAQITLHRVHSQLYAMLSKLIHDVCEWDDCFRTVLANTGWTEVSQKLESRRFRDEGAYEVELQPLFSHLQLLSEARHGMLLDSAQIRKESVQKWTSGGSSQVPIDELLSELQQLDESSHLLFTQSNLQSQTIQSVTLLLSIFKGEPNARCVWEWRDFLKAMSELDFDVEQVDGVVFRFKAPDRWQNQVLVLHMNHKRLLEKSFQNRLAGRLARKFGWCAATFRDAAGNML